MQLFVSSGRVMKKPGETPRCSFDAMNAKAEAVPDQLLMPKHSGTTVSEFIDTSITHDTPAVIANEVKQSSRTKMHFV